MKKKGFDRPNREKIFRGHVVAGTEGGEGESDRFHKPKEK